MSQSVIPSPPNNNCSATSSKQPSQMTGKRKRSNEPKKQRIAHSRDFVHVGMMLALYDLHELHYFVDNVTTDAVLVQVLKNNKDLRRVKITGRSVWYNQEVAKALATLPHLQSFFYCGFLYLSELDKIRLPGTLFNAPNFRKVTKIEFHKVMFWLEDFEIFAKFLRAPENLLNDLSLVGVTCMGGLAPVFMAIKETDTLKRLDVHENVFDEDDENALVDLIENTKSLEYLNIAMTKEAFAGSGFVDALAKNRTLRTLDMVSVFLLGGEFVAMIRLLRRGHTLEDLDMRNNVFPEMLMKFVADMLLENRTLKRLEFDYDPNARNAAENIAIACCYNHRISNMGMPLANVQRIVKMNRQVKRNVSLNSQASSGQKSKRAKVALVSPMSIDYSILRKCGLPACRVGHLMDKWFTVDKIDALPKLRG